MPGFPVNVHRVDPYKGFKFRVRWDGRYVFGVNRIGALRRTTDVVTYREGGDPSTEHKAPGQTHFDPITLERGLSHDTEFERWANAVWRPTVPEAALRSFRKDISIDFFNEAGQLVLRYLVHRCWVSEYVALPALDASTSLVAIERITLQHEGWERDLAVVEPQEPGEN
jgi:phage tail-like protein